jgi:hypothetical protein
MHRPWLCFQRQAVAWITNAEPAAWRSARWFGSPDLQTTPTRGAGAGSDERQTVAKADAASLLPGAARQKPNTDRTSETHGLG